VVLLSYVAVALDRVEPIDPGVFQAWPRPESRQAARPLRLLPRLRGGLGGGAVNIRNRSYTVAAEVDLQTPEAAGVLFSHGRKFGGHSLYLKDGRLKYVHNVGGIVEQMVRRRHHQAGIVDVSGERYIDLEKEAVAMMSRE
jgi:hypothetical protein